MRTYAYEDYGLVLTEETMKMICKKAFIDDPVEDELYGMALYDSDICTCAGNFTGELFPITDKGKDNWDTSEDIYDDEVYYVSINKYPSLFESAYNDIDEMVAEFKEQLGKYLPDDFDYRANIRHIIGTTWG
jgi:hypothetical protein